MTPARFEGGGRWFWVCLLGGVAGLALTAVGALFDLRAALFSYLMAYVYWLGIAVGALILLATFHASEAKWVVVFRRVIEALSGALPIFALLFLPIALGAGQLFVWVHPTGLGPEALARLAHKRAYLNVPFFLCRAVCYFAVWIAASWFLRRWSLRQDETGDRVLTRKQRNLGAGALPFLALALTFASFDWLMSLEPTWYSTVYGVYYFGGAFLAALCAVTLAVCVASPSSALGQAVGADHRHNLGKLVFAFVCFWGYIAYSQYMLIWIANLPIEIPYYLARMAAPWAPVSGALAAAQFVLPFVVLLSREVKRRRRALGALCAWSLAAHALDTYWLVMPAFHPSSALPPWTLLPAFGGVGGVAAAFMLWRMRGGFVLPVRDPFLAESLSFSQP